MVMNQRRMKADFATLLHRAAAKPGLPRDFGLLRAGRSSNTRGAQRQLQLLSPRQLNRLLQSPCVVITSGKGQGFVTSQEVLS